MNRRSGALFAALVACAAGFASPGLAPADEPSVLYIFPAGGQRGTTVPVRVGGCFLHGQCPWSMSGPGVEVPPEIKEGDTVWFEGPVIPLPASQAKEDYPRDYHGTVQIAADAPLGTRSWRVWTSQGVVPARPFLIGEDPEIVEQEQEGEPVPVAVTLPVTINGRIFPRQDIDVYRVTARAGQSIRAEVFAARIDSGLQARLEVRGPDGRSLAEDLGTSGPDPRLQFVAPVDGRYEIRIQDLAFGGLQHYVYRLHVTSGPWVDSVYPLGGQRGASVPFEVSGQALPENPVTISLPKEGPADFMTQLAVGISRTNSFALELSDLPECREAEPNQELAQARPLDLPGVANGRIDRPGDVDLWSFTAKKKDRWEFDLRAHRLGSALDGVLIVSDASGKELARADDLPDGETDARLVLEAPADGTYYVQVRDNFASRGGPRFAYRLRVQSPAEQTFRVTLPTDAITLTPGKPLQLKLAVTFPQGWKAPLDMKFVDLPPGVTPAEFKIPSGRSPFNVALTAAADALPTLTKVKLVGTSTQDGRTLAVTAALAQERGEPLREDVLLCVAVKTPFKIIGSYAFDYISRGGLHRKHYTIERNGYTGPLEVRLADRQGRHLQGIRGPTIVVPADADTFEYEVYLPPWMELGRTSRTNVMGIGTVTTADGKQHRVSYSSQAQNDQIIVRVEPGPLDLQLGQASLRLTGPTTATIPVKVLRGPSLKNLAVSVGVQIPAQMHGITVTPAEIPGDQSEGQLTIQFAADAGPFTRPLLIQATARRDANMWVAEGLLEVVVER